LRKPAVQLAPPVKAQAVVDPGCFEVADRIRDQPFLVTVTGELWQGGEKLKPRTYEIAAPSEGEAAWIGLDRYCREMVRVN
jgi:hypothetical protein